MKKTRTEEDSLGLVKLPRSAMYGAQTARAIENFRISGRTADPVLIRAYLRIKQASAEANRTCGTLSTANARLIVQAIEKIQRLPVTKWKELFPIDVYQAGAGTSQNMNLNEVVANFANQLAGKGPGTYAPIHPNDHVNRSQSTNDTFPSAMRLALLECSSPLVWALEDLAGAFERKAEAWKDIPKAARTHLQDAVPMRLGQEFSGYAAVIRRCAEWVSEGRKELLTLGISGSAAGTGLTVPKTFGPTIIRSLRRLTGEPVQLAPNLFEAMQSQAPVLHYSSMLRLTAVELIRVCNDLRLLASGPMTGLSEIQVPAVQPGSSIMPGKVNPSILEMCNQVCFSVLGLDQTAVLATQAGQLELNVMMPIIACSVIEATQITTHAVMALRSRAIEGLKPNERRLRKYFESTPQIATALSPKLGYGNTAKLVQEAIQKEISITDLVRSRKLLKESELEELIATDALTGGGSRGGRRGRTRLRNRG